MSIVTVTAFRYRPSARFRAFATMGRVLMQPIQAAGLQFSKLMGSGHDFGLVPDLSTYVLVCVWESDVHAQAFFQTNTYQNFQHGTEHTSTLYLQPQRAHGHWDGKNPFDQLTNYSSDPPASRPVAVLTRATIRFKALPDFWRHVPQARQRLKDHADDLLFGIGVGEVPIVQQCTISVWRDADAVDRYAYRQSGHKEIVRLTRQRKWYAEELFARFSVIRAEGELFNAVRKQLALNAQNRSIS